MELLGHSQMRTTMDIYSHVMPALAREAADRMGAVLLSPLATNGNQTGNQDFLELGPSASSPLEMGGAEGTRTPDPHTASVVRYQLRHSPLPGPRIAEDRPKPTWPRSKCRLPAARQRA